MFFMMWKHHCADSLRIPREQFEFANETLQRGFFFFFLITVLYSCYCKCKLSGFLLKSTPEVECEKTLLLNRFTPVVDRTLSVVLLCFSFFFWAQNIDGSCYFMLWHNFDFSYASNSLYNLIMSRWKISLCIICLYNPCWNIPEGCSSLSLIL